MLKVFYDFNNNTSIVPFVFGGLGVVDVKPTIKPYASKMSGWNVSNMALAKINDDGAYVKDDSGNIQSYQSLNMKSKAVVTYAGGFGLSITGSDAISVDVAYSIGGQAANVVGANFASLNLKNLVIQSASSGSDASGGADVSGGSDASGMQLLNSGSTITDANIDNAYIVKQMKFKNHLAQSLTLGLKLQCNFLALRR